MKSPSDLTNEEQAPQVHPGPRARVLRRFLAGGLLMQGVVLAGLHAAVRLPALGVVLSAASAVGAIGLYAVGAVRCGAVPGPADWVTLLRGALVGGVVALVVQGSEPVLLGALAAVALALDLVDGFVARRTRTASALGAHFDEEVDAFLVLVLSAHVATHHEAAWVLVIGLAHYLKLGAAVLWPWLRATAPPRRWAKVVAAVQGVVLVVVAAGAAPRSVAIAAVAVALLLLAESFWTECRWLWRHRAPTWHRPTPRWVTGGALLLVVAVLLLPHTLQGLRAPALVRLPVELLVYLALVLLLPRSLGRLRSGLGWVAGAVLGAVGLLKALDLGFQAVLNRPFDPLADWGYAGETADLARNATGPWLGTALVILGVTTALLLLVLPPLAVRHLTRETARHRVATLRVVAALASLWLVLALVDARSGRNPPLASAATAGYAFEQVTRIPAELRDQREFARSTTTDPVSAVPARHLLTGLRGKDVLIIFVESYGRVAVEGASYSSGVRQVLGSGTARLRESGFDTRTAYLTSPTFGALSWLAHATLHTGLWIDSQRRYDVLVQSPRVALSRLFERAGWRTVAAVPANTEDWPEAGFYGFDEVYDARNVGYQGPRFGYPTMPDQFTLEAFWRHELAPQDGRPVMAEIDLISSHAPWSRTPRLVGQDDVGDGSVFEGMLEQLPSEPEVWSSPDRVRATYGEAIEYSLSAVVEFLLSHGDDDLVVLMLGDHQPATIVSGSDAGHDVPVTLISKDPQVLSRIAGWGWRAGLQPAGDAPVWRMDAFRDAFLAAFGPRQAHTLGVAAEEVER